MLLQLLIITIAILITGAILPGIQIRSFWTAVVIAIVLALLNFFVRPFMVVLSIPFTVITFGLFLFVINAVIILLAGGIVSGFRVKGFWWALIFSIILSVVTYLLEIIIFPGNGVVTS